MTYVRSLARLGGLAIVLVSVAMLVGCQAPDKLVYDNYTRIQTHLSTQADVTHSIGDPDHVLGERWMYERPEKHLNVFVDFDESGRVVRKQWIDALDETWEDSAERSSTKPPYERTAIETTNP